MALTFADQGMDVISFSDGDAAVENLDEVKPDIVLADVNMPGINGYQLCELMRSDQANKDIPVLLLVGSFEPFDREEAERVGSNGHMTKPFSSIAELVSTVQRLLAEAETNVPSGDSAELEQAPETLAPVADTSDIDSLYQQSFVETVEIPHGAELADNFGVDTLDDEMMIATSYAGGSEQDEAEESFFVMEPVDELSNGAADVDLATESLIAESMPSDDEAGVQPAMEPANVSDPFETLAADTPVPNVSETFTPSASSFGLDDMDLLEIPSAAAFVPQQSAAVSELSPELIDRIVDKVIERLEQKRHAASGD